MSLGRKKTNIVLSLLQQWYLSYTPPSCRLYSWLISHVSRGSLINIYMYIVYMYCNILTCTAHSLDIVLTLTKLKNDAYTYIFGIFYPAGCKRYIYIGIYIRGQNYLDVTIPEHTVGAKMSKKQREKNVKKFTSPRLPRVRLVAHQLSTPSLLGSGGDDEWTQ